MKRYVGAIEAGGTKFNCAIVDPPQTIIREARIPTRSPGETLSEVLSFFQSADVPLIALGVSCFGPIDLDVRSGSYGHITQTPKLAWCNTDIVGSLKMLKLPVGFDTDVNGAALGEYTCGAGKNLSSLVYYTIGTGIGGGVLVEGQPLHGLTHPEMGHTLIPHDKNQDPFVGCCPFHGDCFEGLASGPALEKRWNTDPSKLPEDHPAWRLEAHYIALALSNTILTLSPQKLILGGGVMSNQFLFPLIRKNVQDCLRGYVHHKGILEEIDSFIVPPALGDRAGIIGAATLGLRQATRNP